MQMKWMAMLGIVCLASLARAQQTDACTGAQAQLRLPPGFCATVFADQIGHARHLAVAANGVVYVNTWSGRYYGNRPPHEGGFLVALQDSKGSGSADVIERFGETVQTNGAGGTGIYLHGDGLYAEINDRIVRYRLLPGSIVPREPPRIVVSGLPLGGNHPMHPFAIDADGWMYVDVASATNACQLKDRSALSPGANPCKELETRGGIWRFDSNRYDQKFSSAQRYASGIRNAEGFAVDSAGHRLFVTQHGRDQLHSNWPDLYRPEEEATLPAEELLNLRASGDYGWPECYFDPYRGSLVLAPEYGGDGGKKVGTCAQKTAPIAIFPAHWAPNGMTFYDHDQFPARYRNGVFIAFHGSWNRAPFAQNGYNVVFQSLAGDGAGNRCEIFADGFAGALKSPGTALHRPAGVAVGPDGALYVADDVGGRIYKISYHGDARSDSGTEGVTVCPSPTSPPEPAEAAGAGARSMPDLPVPAAATSAMVKLGDLIYHGQVGGAACTGCHGLDGHGTPLGPDLTDTEWLWSDGSYPGIAKTIAAGVMQPKQFRAPMPPNGGAALTPEQVSAAAAYVWALGHRHP